MARAPHPAPKGPGTNGSIIGWRWVPPFRQKEHATCWGIIGWRWGIPMVWTDTQTKNITLPHPSAAGGNKRLGYFPRSTWFHHCHMNFLKLTWFSSRNKRGHHKKKFCNRHRTGDGKTAVLSANVITNSMLLLSSSLSFLSLPRTYQSEHNYQRSFQKIDCFTLTALFMMYCGMKWMSLQHKPGTHWFFIGDSVELPKWLNSGSGTKKVPKVRFSGWWRGSLRIGCNLCSKCSEC